jgi:hypothetical protein
MITGDPTCDMCLNTMCCNELTACGTVDDAGLDDAGSTACNQYVSCVQDCQAGNPDAGVDGGTLADCQTTCGMTYTSTETTNGNALLTCFNGPCASACGGGGSDAGSD